MDERKIKEIIDKDLFDKDRMFNNIKMKIEEDELKNNLKILLLLILNRKESYGVEISKELLILTKDKLKERERLIYPMLHRLENEGLIKSYWKFERRYYFIDLKGKAYLEERKSIVEKLRGGKKIALKEEFSWI
ncbi:helix-turn-helix transcriptional regulator [uncultured Clostridium sp.]|uniref:PadR family transcriptional regulator n=1 Tax=uncultured Clostridium sp. TaxID=59620 RepID=UPI002626DA02|nr:helix-turn-helix transcriptional regulator [uncultured Clostridium sp.]